jgi:hypothetical protein
VAAVIPVYGAHAGKNGEEKYQPITGGSHMRAHFPVILVLIVFLFGGGCGEDKASSPDNKSAGTLKIHLTDTPGYFDKVNITFSEIAINRQGDSEQESWIVIKGEPQTFDLLTLSNGATSLLGEKQLEPGQYSQIRLKLTGAEVVIKGVSYTLDVPSGSTSGLKLGTGFTIEPGITTEFVVDFDVARSIHTTGKKQEYKLNPRLRLIAKASSGAISGKVTNYLNDPVAYAISGVDTVTSVVVKKDTGGFLLGFLPPGTFTVSVADTLKKSHEKTGVTVTLGSVTNIGDITLQ